MIEKHKERIVEVCLSTAIFFLAICCVGESLLLDLLGIYLCIILLTIWTVVHVEESDSNDSDLPGLH